ncbi:hypothetical protein GCM10009868_40850 [Terrabacter aerolatus]|uniref:Uncharacterized protein n=2 Tax=Terrabacter aerolatus TaxID=422442 RepID=A0A512D604_9MICO|nr:hypothetical protein TAE01_37090 [Terrabacter aerolatus]
MSSSNLLDRASAELHCAADQAEARAQGNPLDPWSAMAGTVRLLAAALNPMPVMAPVAARELQGHFTTALGALDELALTDAPRDLPFWRAHIVDLKANAQMLELGAPKAGS